MEMRTAGGGAAGMWDVTSLTSLPPLTCFPFSSLSDNLPDRGCTWLLSSEMSLWLFGCVVTYTVTCTVIILIIMALAAFGGENLYLRISK